ncbi:hypothetical protein V494_05008 [Pseudogymnoascus sp. VKM F-4513 (FW-928)]|nr:hypothetical protein V494_05008 [Pseudogymnoascus sp. VKM F-4513 (FW-928)]
MSRNVRQRPNTSHTGQKTPRRSRNTLTSDEDDDYSGVDLISDSEEDEPDVEVAEEQAIIESEEEDDFVNPQPTDNEDEFWGPYDSLKGGPDLFPDDQTDQSLPADVLSGAAEWMGSADDSEPEVTRRVRFDLSDSETVGSDIDDNIFPDIFLDQGSLDPGFRRTIENDKNKDNDDSASDDGSYWDFRGEDDEMVEDDVDDDGDNKSESSCGSSGYETDEGETTEEDLPPQAQYLPARTVLRGLSSDASDSDDDIQVIQRKQYRPQRTGPKLGSWITDANKPFAVLDSRGKRLMMFRARINRRHSTDSVSGPNRMMTIDEDDRDASGMEQMSPMISNSANLMMSALYTPMDNLGGQALGPPEAFYPFVSISANGNMTQDCPSSSFDEDDVDDEDIWNIGDLIDFGDSSSDDDANDDDDEDDSCDSNTVGMPSSTPVRPSTANSEDQAHPLITHLAGRVGAFRSNQNRHSLLSRNSASRESLAFSGRYGQGAIRGIKGGRLAAANTPITPLRKSKISKAELIVSPSPAEGTDKKRKFTGESHGHKRVRSLF